MPTTLLCAVDAAVGGKTGINFGGLKNEIGAFSKADSVIISTKFFGTLPETEIKSGFAEMLKHALLRSNAELEAVLKVNLAEADSDEFLPLLAQSVMIKQEVVAQDPYEHGIRKALNLGHTAGHAFESLALRRNTPVPHGYAVAWGLVMELVLSNLIMKFDSQLLQAIARFVDANYRPYNFGCDDYDELISLMRHDKKSRNGELNFTLLCAPGDVVVDCGVDEETVKIALDVFRDLMHI